MSNETQSNHNEKNLLEGSERNTKKLIGWAIACVGFILIVAVLFWFLNSFKSSNNETAKETNKNLTDSVKNDIDWTAKSKEQNLLSLAENEPQSFPDKTPPSMPQIKETTIVKPRIIKGMGVALVSSNANEAVGSNSFAQEKNDLTLQDKPDTVLEFGQNGSVNLAQNSLSGGSMQGEVFTPTAASYSKFNPSLLLPKGTYIGCALKTRLVSEIKGGIACIVSNDVYSSNGHTLLIEKGSTITGTYSGGELNDGSTRLFVIWQEVRTPNNIIIPVNSNATDELGASGVEGYVNHHYMKRFGAAILLSIIDDTFSVIADKLSNNSKNNYYNYTENSREQASKIAEIALEKMIDIKPTLYKNQGDLVGVYVNRDIDFSKVYQLRRKRRVFLYKNTLPHSLASI